MSHKVTKSVIFSVKLKTAGRVTMSISNEKVTFTKNTLNLKIKRSISFDQLDESFTSELKKHDLL